MTEQFARVFGDNEDHVHSCIDCTANTDLYDGAGSNGDGATEVAATAWEQ
ncbi:hypothetical protein G9C83_02880 [Halobacterium sp. R2-5]|nr:hypothetical protein [Halobacterium sp. R2-5]